MNSEIRLKTDAIVAEYGDASQCDLLDCVIDVVDGYDLASEAVKQHETSIMEMLGGEETAEPETAQPETAEPAPVGPALAEPAYDASLYDLSTFSVEIDGHPMT